MPSSKRIQDIKTNLLHPATTSHFYVEIDTTWGQGENGRKDSYLPDNGVKLDQGKLNLLCAEATLPGSNLATLELTSDHTGVTERHAYRRVYDDRIDLTFYVDVDNYLPIRFFETWMKWIASESIEVKKGEGSGLKDESYNYRFKYRDEYAVQGLKITKFERSNYGSGIKGAKATPLTYGFVRSYPISISSMPVSYDSSSLLKCTVGFTYMRYYVGNSVDNDGEEIPKTKSEGSADNPFNTPLTAQQQAAVNAGYAGKVDFTRGLNIPPTTTGGFSIPAAQSSGNNLSVQDAYSGNFTLNR